MSYQIEQKIGRNIYVYEVTGYWDKEKKQSRQKRKYLGKKDLETGKIVNKSEQTTVKMVCDFGCAFLVHEVIKHSGIKETIESVFSSFSSMIIKLIVFDVIESEPLYLFQKWHEGIYGYKKSKCSSQDMSDFTLKLSKMEYQRELFIQRWVKHQKDDRGIFFDITSFSSYSNLIDIVEWGYNRDGEKLPQVNFGILLGFPSNLPLLYSVHQSSISDVTTLKNISAKLDALNLKNITLVLDRGFYSQANIVEMHNSFENFIIPMPFSTKISLEILEICKNISSSKNIFFHNKKAIFYYKHKFYIQEKEVYSHLFFDEERRSRELSKFMAKIAEIEEDLNKIDFKLVDDANSYLKEKYKNDHKYFTVYPLKNSIECSRNHENMATIIDRMGKMILLTKQDMDKEKVLDLYKDRESVEHCFDILKNEMNHSRLRVKSRQAMEGRLFLVFLGIIVRKYIANIMKEKNLYKKMTYKEMLMELRKIKSIRMVNNKTHLTEISKKQKLILKAFNVKIPAGQTTALN